MKLTIDREAVGQRIDVFLSTQLEDVTRTSVRKLLEDGYILVNDRTEKQNYRLREGDLLIISRPEPVELDVLPEDIPLDILHEDDALVVVNKPQGMVVHPSPGHSSGTLVNALLHHCRGRLSGINGILRPGIVHRIDMDTSGVLVVAKTDLAHQCLARQLADHSMKRKYNALVYDNLKSDVLTIDKPIGRHPIDRKKMTVTDKNARRAVTHIQVLERFGRFTHVEASLETGRTHQIRVHMASIGHPLVGDPVYGPKRQAFPLKGQALHARLLGFVHPVSERYIEFESALPGYFRRLLEDMQK